MKTWTQRTLAMLLALLTLLACAVTTASAAPNVPDLTVTVNNRAVTFDSFLGSPFIDSQNRTMVPFRAVANFMEGVEVDWSSDSKMAFFSKEVFYNNNGIGSFLVQVVFPIGTNQAWLWVTTYSSNRSVRTSYRRFLQMDTVAQVYNGRTYAPIRYLAEYLNYTVGWNGKTKTVSLTSPSGNWASAFMAKENKLGYKNIVPSDYLAWQYASIFIRYTYGNLDPNISYLGDGMGQSGNHYWTFLYQVDQQNTMQIRVVQDGSVYWNLNDGGYKLWA